MEKLKKIMMNEEFSLFNHRIPIFFINFALEKNLKPFKEQTEKWHF